MRVGICGVTAASCVAPHKTHTPGSYLVLIAMLLVIAAAVVYDLQVSRHVEKKVEFERSGSYAQPKGEMRWIVGIAVVCCDM